MKATALAVMLVLASGVCCAAQQPTGSVSGVVTYQAKQRLRAVAIRLVSLGGGQTRTTQTSADGQYSVAALPPAVYRLTAQHPGFKELALEVVIDAGSETVADVSMTAGDVSEQVTVSGAAPLMHPDDHSVGGVVTREQISDIPLNGRNFLDLAKLEPGVSNPVRAGFGRTFISIMGSGLQTIPRVGYTRVTVDGASIVAPGAVGTFMQVSQEAVQEFQLSSASFDPAIGLTTNGAVNIVTRSGGATMTASLFSFYRDHHLSAYPGLQRSAANPDPFFQRLQFGGSAGGPVWGGRLHVFATAERDDEHSVATVQPKSPAFAGLGGIFSSPSATNLTTLRADFPLSGHHSAFVRYTSDRATSFSGNSLPSAWDHQTNDVTQIVGSVTSTVRATVVNALTASWFDAHGLVRPPTAEECSGCFGLDAVHTTVANTGITFGRDRSAMNSGARVELNDTMAWQRGGHRLTFGANWDRMFQSPQSPDQVFAEMTLWPSGTAQHPSAYTSPAAIWQLPLQAFNASAGESSGPWLGFSNTRIMDVYRVSVGDAWRARDRLTLNGGLGWSLEPNALNSDLTKPALLEALLGPDGLRPPRASYTDFSPSLGVIWVATSDHRTLVRAGVGRYLDPISGTNSVNLSTERQELLPVGVGQITRTAGNFPFGAGIAKAPGSFTGAQLLNLLPGIQEDMLSLLNPSNRDFSIRNLDLTKQGQNLYDPSYRSPSSVQVTAGVQRELPHGAVISADFVWKRFSHTFVNGIDYNHFGSVAGPVIPQCSPAQQNDPAAVCSNGGFFFDTTIGKARYRGLLVRLERRFDGRFQLLGSYTLGSYVGTNGTGLGTAENANGLVFGFDNNNWYENYGPLPTDVRHMLNVSGVLRLPWSLQASLDISAYSRPPFTAYVANMDFNGDGTTNDLLPGSTINAFGRSLNEADLRALVAAYNATYAGRMFGGQIAKPIVLPPDFSFNDNFFTQDVRLSRPIRVRGWTFTGMVDVFNVLNTANLVQFSGNLAAPGFGQPLGRFTQLFGSGGPRAVQFAVRLAL